MTIGVKREAKKPEYIPGPGTYEGDMKGFGSESHKFLIGERLP